MTVEKKRMKVHPLVGVALFCTFCFVLYSQAIHKKQHTLATLQARLSSMQEQKENLLQEKEELLLDVRSQSDPAWVEMVLMKVLGLVPEGKVKVYFDPTAQQ